MKKSNNLFVWDALISWSQYINKNLRGNTSVQYLTSMLKLIEKGVVDVQLSLECATEGWLQESCTKIDHIPEWSLVTKDFRKKYLKLFYRFLNRYFDYRIKPYHRHPKQNEIKYLFSHVLDQQLTLQISPVMLYESIRKRHRRDACIILLMMYTGEKIGDILDSKKEDFQGIYLDFEENGIKRSHTLPEHMATELNEICKNSKVYLFETVNGKKIPRNQIVRALKKSSRDMKLSFCLSPKSLHRYSNTYLSMYRRSDLEKIHYKQD